MKWNQSYSKFKLNKSTTTTGFHTIRYLLNLFFIVGECGQDLQDTILAGDELDV
jgi:hypothetical protein